VRSSARFGTAITTVGAGIYWSRHERSEQRRVHLSHHHRLVEPTSLRAVTDPVSAKSIADLRGMSKTDLVAAHDGMIKLGGYVEDPENYRAELARRDAEEQTAPCCS
jgi:hypothetical protein